jgi:LacI family transcriptional regulator
VLVDNERGAYNATTALIADGHQRIGFVGGDPLVSTSQERYLGYERAMKAAGLRLETDFIRFGPAHFDWGYRAMEEMAPAPNRPNAFFMVNLYTHIGATHYLLSNGRPKESLVFASFDETQYSSLLPFCRYAVAQPIAQLGAAAAHLVIERTTGARTGPPVIRRLTTQLIRH